MNSLLEVTVLLVFALCVWATVALFVTSRLKWHDRYHNDRVVWTCVYCSISKRERGKHRLQKIKSKSLDGNGSEG